MRVQEVTRLELAMMVAAAAAVAVLLGASIRDGRRSHLRGQLGHLPFSVQRKSTAVVLLLLVVGVGGLVTSQASTKVIKSSS